jgi:plastin-1
MVEANPSPAPEAYEVPYMYRKYFNPEQITELLNAFKSYDADKSGTIDGKEFKNALKAMGHTEVTDEQANGMLAKVDKNNDQVIEWLEFLDMMQIVKKNGNNFGDAIAVGGAAGNVIEGKSGAKISYQREEVSMIARTITNTCKDDSLVTERLPINPDNDDLFHALADGMVLIHLLNHIEEDAIDMRTVNKGSNINIYKVRENLDAALLAASTRIKMMGVDAQSFIDKNPQLMLGVLWQIVRIISTKKIELKNVPEIIRLAEGDEEMKDLLKLPAENILIRWLNFHLKAAGQPGDVKNLGSDLKDSKRLIYVMNQLDGSQCSLDALSTEDDVERAQQMLDNSVKLNVPDVAGASDICKGNPRVNTVFVAELFNAKHGLEELTQEQYDAAALLDDDNTADSKEERQFRMWINSLQIEDCFVVDLYDDVRDGLVLLKVCDKIKPGTVNWAGVSKKPKNVFERNGNCDEAERAATALGVKMIGIGSEDIREGRKQGVLAIVWQLMRTHYLQIIGSKTDAQILEWVNTSSGREAKSFGDPVFGDGTLLIDLARSIEPRVVNEDLVMKDDSEESKILNAKYAISIARKLGAIVFLVYDDILGLNKKMILIFVCSLYDLAQQAK